MEKTDTKKRNYREEVNAFLIRRRIKNVIGTLVWLRVQKAQKLEANQARVEEASIEVGVLDEMVLEAEKAERVSIPSGLKTYRITSEYMNERHGTLVEASSRKDAVETFKKDHPDSRILEIHREK